MMGTLNLNNGGIVDISKYNMDDAPEEAIVEGVATGADRTAATNHKVSVTNLNGSNGLFKMDLNYLDENGAVYTGNKGDNDVSDYLDIQTVIRSLILRSMFTAALPISIITSMALKAKQAAVLTGM